MLHFGFEADDPSEAIKDSDYFRGMSINYGTPSPDVGKKVWEFENELSVRRSKKAFTIFVVIRIDPADSAQVRLPRKVCKYT